MNSDKIKLLHHTRHKCDLRHTIVFDAKLIIEEPPVKKPFREYKKLVWKKTEEIAHQIPGIEKRGWKNYHIDHIISIWQGYRSKIPASYIAALDNLRMLPFKENLSKGRKSDYVI
jgi:hypothetical protein